MRISSLHHSSAMLAQLGVNGSRISKLMEQMSTQKRINVPSDDPVAASRLAQLSREQSAISQYQNNIAGLSGALAIQESNITALGDRLDAINSKLLSANNSTWSQQDLAGIGAELSSMLDSLVEVMNARSESGSYLFSGTKTDTRPVVQDGSGRYVYSGNNSGRETEVGSGVHIRETTPVAGALSATGNDLALLNQLRALSEKMQDPALRQEDYREEITAMLGQVKTSSDAIASLYTDLGSRQNRLELLKNAHTDVSTANEQVIRELSDTDWATASVNLQLYMNSMQISNKTYSMVSQLNLFSLL
ncbi:flagellar hook-associated protein FlgL [Pluralibacter gergoviae]|uniref:flagellar hook-associated protein FlgL n=1 Tax=Pluralibacter gergoviae TaxID=61647 RepID=UPI003EDFBE9C